VELGRAAVKCPTANGPPAPGSRSFLEAEGFEGFFTVRQLHAEGCEGLPNEPGVYAIVRESLDLPEFLTRSVGPIYRGKDPTRPVDELKQRWVTGAQMLYVGRACGPGVRSLLRQRVKRYLRFGHGRVVGHWGGRFVWQLCDHTTLQVAWKSTGLEDPSPVEARLQARFREHYSVLPFANLNQESEE
jgi:hypothetical protein